MIVKATLTTVNVPSVQQVVVSVKHASGKVYLSFENAANRLAGLIGSFLLPSSIFGLTSIMESTSISRPTSSSRTEKPSLSPESGSQSGIPDMAHESVASSCPFVQSYMLPPQKLRDDVSKAETRFAFKLVFSQSSFNSYDR